MDHGGLHNNNSDMSLKISQALDHAGYSLPSITTAKLITSSLQTLIQKKSSLGLGNVPCFIVGSKKEGISFFDNDSDFDLMYIDPMNFGSCGNLESDRSGFRMHLRDIPPGYCLLEFLNKSNIEEIFTSELNGNTFLQNDSIFYDKDESQMDASGPRMVHKHIDAEHIKRWAPDEHLNILELLPCIQRSGPSNEVSHDLFIKDGRFSVDTVSALRAENVEYIETWRCRKRNHTFPGPQLIEDISKLDAHVVPVGCKGTDNKQLQWRICFTFAEISLIHSFNETQYKVYILLKILLKQIIRKVFPDITSYVIKNILLWVSEINPRVLFRRSNILLCLKMCLYFLRQCVKNRHLPNYMIPDRDMLYGRLDEQTIQSLDRLLKCMISECASLVLKCTPIANNLHLLELLPVSMKELYNPIHPKLIVLLGYTMIVSNNDFSTTLQEGLMHTKRLIETVRMLKIHLHVIPAVILETMGAVIKMCKSAILRDSHSPFRKNDLAVHREMMIQCYILEWQILEKALLYSERDAKRKCAMKLFRKALDYGDHAIDFLRANLPVSYLRLHMMYKSEPYRNLIRNFFSKLFEISAQGQTGQYNSTVLSMCRVLKNMEEE